MGEPEIAVRRAEPEDLASIVELWRKLSEEKSAADERYALRSDAETIWTEWAGQQLCCESSIALVATRGDTCVGFLVGHVEETQPIYEQRHYANISDVYISLDSRRKGLASRLVQEAVEFFRQQGLRHICIKVVAGHAPSRAFCDKLGFADTVARSSHVGIAMWKPLG